MSLESVGLLWNSWSNVFLVLPSLECSFSGLCSWTPIVLSDVLSPSAAFSCSFSKLARQISLKSGSVSLLPSPFDSTKTTEAASISKVNFPIWSSRTEQNSLLKFWQLSKATWYSFRAVWYLRKSSESLWIKSTKVDRARTSTSRSSTSHYEPTKASFKPRDL